MIEYLISFVGGILSVFSPCILPVLPVIFATAEGRWWRSILVVLGLVFSFGILGLVLGVIGSFSLVSYLAFALLLIFGIVLLFDFKIPFVSSASAFGSKTLGGVFGKKMIGSSRPLAPLYSFFLGMSLGVIWSPCIGPILGAIVALVAASGSAFSGFFLMLSYSLGMSLAISLILIAGSRFSGRLVENHTTVNRIFGIIILAFLFLMVTGVLDFFEILLTQKLQGFEEWASRILRW